VSVYRWVEHTGELELEIEAASEREIFEDGFAAMRELLAGEATEPLPPTRVTLEGSDHAALLAEWLTELAYLAERDRLVPRRLPRLELDECGLAAVVEGARGDPPQLVKAATYHRLALGRSGSGWRATVVLDV
jgi:SHS2 domain-containing protein